MNTLENNGAQLVHCRFSSVLSKLSRKKIHFIRVTTLPSPYSDATD